MLAAFSGFLSVLFALVLCLRRPWGIVASGPLRRRVECLLQDASALTPGVRILHGSLHTDSPVYAFASATATEKPAVLAVSASVKIWDDYETESCKIVADRHWSRSAAWTLRSGASEVLLERGAANSLSGFPASYRRTRLTEDDLKELAPDLASSFPPKPGRAYLLDEYVVLQGVAVMAIGLLSPLAQEPQPATPGRPRFRMAGSANGPLTLSTSSPTGIFAEHERRQFLAALAAGVLSLYGAVTLLWLLLSF